MYLRTCEIISIINFFSSASCEVLETIRAMRVWQFLVQASNWRNQTRSCRMIQAAQSVFPMSRRSLSIYQSISMYQRFHLPAQATSGLIGRVYMIWKKVLVNGPLEPLVPLHGFELSKLKPTSPQDFCQGARDCWESQDPGLTANGVCVSSPHVERVEFAYCFASNFRMFLLCSPILESCVKAECTG